MTASHKHRKHSSLMVTLADSKCSGFNPGQVFELFVNFIFVEFV